MRVVGGRNLRSEGTWHENKPWMQLGLTIHQIGSNSNETTKYQKSRGMFSLRSPRTKLPLGDRGLIPEPIGWGIEEESRDM